MAAKGTRQTQSSKFTAPGLSSSSGADAARMLQERLESVIDLALTLKHIHWNVVGPTFIGVHTMLDPQVDGVAAMVDETAERIAVLGASPNGLAGNLVKNRSWDDYSLNRAVVPQHLAALDLVYRGVIEDHRTVIDKLDDIDPITQDMLIGHTAQLELYQWFVRAHLESQSGSLVTAKAKTETGAAAAVSRADSKGAESTQPSTPRTRNKKR